jgi:hypothetical protein
MRYFLSRKEPKIDDSGEFSFESSDRGLVSFALGSLAIFEASNTAPKEAQGKLCPREHDLGRQPSE